FRVTTQGHPYDEQFSCIVVSDAPVAPSSEETSPVGVRAILLERAVEDAKPYDGFLLQQWTNTKMGG
ncbi:MAG: hypothetical protein RSE93_07060, partial [Oscillospiraceae bacterium]